MTYAVKTAEPCIDCGTPTTKRQNYSCVPLCINCGIQRALQEMRRSRQRRAVRIYNDRVKYQVQRWGIVVEAALPKEES